MSPWGASAVPLVLPVVYIDDRRADKLHDGAAQKRELAEVNGVVSKW